jgi:hypothetical protein
MSEATNCRLNLPAVSKGPDSISPFAANAKTPTVSKEPPALNATLSMHALLEAWKR